MCCIFASWFHGFVDWGSQIPRLGNFYLVMFTLDSPSLFSLKLVKEGKLYAKWRVLRDKDFMYNVRGHEQKFETLQALVRHCAKNGLNCGGEEQNLTFGMPAPRIF